MTARPTPVDVPVDVLLALMVLVNHVEPGWEHCTTVVRQWLREQVAAREPTP